MYCRDCLSTKEEEEAKIQFDKFFDVIAKKHMDKFWHLGGKMNVQVLSLGYGCIAMKSIN